MKNWNTVGTLFVIQYELENKCAEIVCNKIYIFKKKSP